MADNPITAKRVEVTVCGCPHVNLLLRGEDGQTMVLTMGAAFAAALGLDLLNSAEEMKRRKREKKSALADTIGKVAGHG
jgi:hypothetical protein